MPTLIALASHEASLWILFWIPSIEHLVYTGAWTKHKLSYFKQKLHTVEEKCMDVVGSAHLCIPRLDITTIAWKQRWQNTGKWEPSTSNKLVYKDAGGPIFDPRSWFQTPFSVYYQSILITSRVSSTSCLTLMNYLVLSLSLWKSVF